MFLWDLRTKQSEIARKVVGERYKPDAKSRQYDDMLGSFVKNGLTQSQAESESLLQILGLSSIPVEDTTDRVSTQPAPTQPPPPSA